MFPQRSKEKDFCWSSTLRLHSAGRVERRSLCAKEEDKGDRVVEIHGSLAHSQVLSLQEKTTAGPTTSDGPTFIC